MPTKDPEKRKAHARAHYARNREKVVSAVRTYREQNRDKTRALIRAWKSANPDKVQEQHKRAAERKGRTYRGPEYKTELSQKAQDRLAAINAIQAWQYWLQQKAPDKWMAAYYEAKGEPWSNTRLTGAEQYRMHYRLDPIFQIKERLRRQITKAKKRDGIAENIRGAIRRNGRSPIVERMLGYTIAELRRHLERQFTKGMDWATFMAGEIHIDHIVPMSTFDMADDEQFRMCWALTNLRPLWAKENIAKSDKVLYLV